MNWLAKINMPGGEWYLRVVTAEDDKQAIEIAYDGAIKEGYEIESITVEPFDITLHGDIRDYHNFS